MILAEKGCANVDTPVLRIWGGFNITATRY